MTQRVWKYELKSVLSDLHMPVGAEILTVQLQHDQICLWAKVNVNAPKVKRTFQMIGTDHVIADDRVTYIGTVQLVDGNLVFHIFERH